MWHLAKKKKRSSYSGSVRNVHKLFCSLKKKVWVHWFAFKKNPFEVKRQDSKIKIETKRFFFSFSYLCIYFFMYIFVLILICLMCATTVRTHSTVSCHAHWQEIVLADCGQSLIHIFLFACFGDLIFFFFILFPIQWPGFFNCLMTLQRWQVSCVWVLVWFCSQKHCILYSREKQKKVLLVKKKKKKRCSSL